MSKEMAKKVGRKAGRQGSNLANVDIPKLYQYFKDNDIPITRTSVFMGYDESWLSAVLHGRWGMSYPAYKMLCMLLKVEEDEFIIKEKPEVVETKKDAEVTTTTPQNITVNAIAPESMDALVSAINAHLEVLDRIYEEIHALSGNLAHIVSKQNHYNQKYPQPKPTVYVKPTGGQNDGKAEFGNKVQTTDI